jgi:hypothetical protein
LSTAAAAPLREVAGVCHGQRGAQADQPTRGEPVVDVGEARLRVHVDGAVIYRGLACESSGPDSEHPGEALGRVLTAWQATELSGYAHIWRVTDLRGVDHRDAVLLVRRPDRRVHPIMGCELAGVDCVSEVSEPLGWRM